MKVYEGRFFHQWNFETFQNNAIGASHEYRVIYVISDGSRLVTVAVIGHRREVYR